MNKFLRKLISMTMIIVIALTFSGCGFLDFLRSFDEVEPPIYNVVKDTPKTVELIFPSGRYLSTSEEKYSDCVLVVNGGTLNANAYEVEWTVDGEKTKGGATYSIPPSPLPAVVPISATLTFEEKDDKGVVQSKNLTASAKFVYCDDIPTQATVVTQRNDDGASFEMQGVSGEEYLVEWFVNGKLYAEGSSFRFTAAEVGEFEVIATVNGKVVAVPDGNVVVSGDKTITGLYVDYDTYYPKVLVGWDRQGDCSYKIRVTTVDGEIFKQVDTNYCQLSLDQIPLDDKSVAVSVKSLGDGRVYSQSAYCKDLVIPALDAQQVEYLGKSYGIENAYLTSNEEFYQQFDHILVTREQPINGDTETQRTFYMGYDYKANGTNLSGLVDVAFDRCGYAGSYSLGSSVSGNIATITVVFKTPSVPNVPTLSNVPNSYAKNLNGYQPAISEVGMSSDELPIDEKPGVSVENTDALYRVAEWGYRPIVEAGSRVEAYYAYARDVLKTITDESMDEYETVLAIYDYIMFVNNYNNDVVSLETNEAVKSPAFYVEGVLAPGYGYAVCDGIAKTFSLLCNMKGIECVRVTGEAGYDGKLGPHAWNKVKVDGSWYVVDATWGDLILTMEYKNGPFAKKQTGSFELGLHTFFLVSDADIATNHVEIDAGYPKTAPVGYNYYARKQIPTLNGVYDTYINEQGAEMSVQMSVIAQLIGREVNGKLNISVGERTVMSDFYLYEVKYHSQNANEVMTYFTSNGEIAREIRASGGSYLFHKTESTVIIIISTNLTLANNSLK